MNGYIKLHRKFTKWGWYQDANTARVFLHLLLTANHHDGEYMGHTIKAGQVVTGRKAMAKILQITENQVRAAIKHLKMTGEITIKTTNRFSIVTIEKWEQYQVCDRETTNTNTNRPPTDHQQTTTSKKEKKEKKEKNKRGKPADWISELVPEELQEGFTEWADMRKEIKKPISSRETVKRAMEKLERLSRNRETQKKIISQSVDRCWAGFFELKEKKPATPYKEFKPEPKKEGVEMPDEIRESLNGLFGKV